MKKIVIFRLIMIFLILTSLSCKTENTGSQTANTGSKTDDSLLNNVTMEEWERLSQKKIVFGHKSVGFDIINGIKDIMQKHPYIKLNITETINPSDLDTPIFAHYEIGSRSFPGTKVERFEKSLENGVGHKVDIAFFKYCYIDIIETTDIKELFNQYVLKMNELQKKYPDVVFINASVPLTTQPEGLEKFYNMLTSTARKILGKFDWNIFFDNGKRNIFNDMLRNEFGGEPTFWDIAHMESTRPDGSQEVYKKGKELYFSMYPGYTDDGGHLNAYGRVKIAEQLLLTLAKLP